jgi:2-polyprenyl-3-methyl-5-hydroxy-6-metoxy-1,4-benzoquinol methylase
MATQALDEGKAEAFVGRMVGILNDAGLALMTSIGHQTGLFDALAAMPPATSAEIASAAHLNERYVREWLGAMVTGQIVEYDPAAQTYRLPPEHAAALVRAAGTGNLADDMQFIALLGGVEADVVACFRAGGGVPYSRYPRFQALMAEDSGAVLDGSLLETVLPLVPGLPDRLRAGIDVLDVGCGQGHAINLMARAFPQSRFAGYDFSEQGIAAGRAEAERMGLTNARFELKDLRALDDAARYDLVTAFDAIHDQAQPAQLLAAVARALRPQGVFLMVDVAASSRLDENREHPLGPFLYTVSTMHCMTVSLALGGAGLGTVWGEQTARQMLADAGLAHVEVRRIEGDIINSYYVATRE